MLTRQTLLKIRTRAMRQRVWYKTLSRLERSILDLTIKCVEKVRSRVLARIVSKIVSEILKTLENTFMNRAEMVGREIAARLYMIAERWGNNACSVWRDDEAFVRFLGVNTINMGE